ncbi:MAG: redoxin domain-containing protein [Sedimentisphaerales bacterium]|nr:redoxin domain-containing protein [Sedimentisphaerales bacterium]
MFIQKTSIPCFIFLVSFISLSMAQQVKQVTFTGTVTDSKGSPINGAKVTVYEMWSDGIAGNMYLNIAGEKITTENGAFIFSTEPKPEKSTFIWSYVVAAKANLSLGWANWTMKDDLKQNIILDKVENIEGVIVDDIGKPVAGADIYASLSRTVESSNGQKETNWLLGLPPLGELITKTNERGRFSFSGLPFNTSVDLLIRAAGKATLYTRLPGQPEEPAFRTGQTDIKVTLPNEARIEGKIIDPDSGEGVAGLKFAVVYTGSGLFFYRFVCQTDNNGNFGIGGLLNSEYLIRGTALPFKYVNCISGQTTNVTIHANKPYYGRITYEDGSSVITKPEPWEGAETRIDFIVDGENVSNRVDIDKDGYFRVYMSNEQYDKIQSRKAWFEINVPSTYTSDDNYLQRVMRMEQIFAIDLLSTDKTKAGVVKIPKPRQKFISLIGKSLSDFNDIKVDYSIKQARGKMILICFFDIEQRPSRNCVIELSKKTEEFKAKEIEVLLIHAAKAEKEYINNWCKENNISFSIGMIEKDEEQIKFNWGIKALPWLILTDKEHIVTDEGFSITEMDEKIQN